MDSSWWARQDSNLQPDGYEPSALTIELHAPPGPPRLGGSETERLTYLAENCPLEKMPASVPECYLRQVKIELAA